ncbi:response regulator transcription factor [Streptomyces sp. NPDC059063]|uniref:helix-turn-helix transcriptional regulator n=1 Tax=unclassified Streptomyces TaxID=2593676 RepID=UPI0036AAE7E9
MGASERVAVVAQSGVVRAGLARLLEEAAEVEQYAVFEPGEFAAPAREDAIQVLILSCDVLLLWCASGLGLGAEAWVRELAGVARRNGIRVALLVPGSEMQQAVSRGGVPCDGILDQNALTAHGLDDALRRLASGERLRPEPAVRTGPSAAAPDAAATHTGTPIGLLTEREQRVLELLADGLSNKQIGVTLGISEHSAKRVVALVLSKLNSPNRTQAVAVALHNGLVGAEPALDVCNGG